MSEQENIKAAHAFFDAWNAGDLSHGEPYQTDGHVAEGPGAAGPMNKEQNRAYLQNFLTAFPGSKFEVLLTVTQGDYIVMHWRVGGGAHTGPLHTPSGGVLPPTGKTATFEADGLPASEAVEMLEGAFDLNSRALQRFLATIAS